MPHPLFIDHAKGAHIWDADGNEFVDFVVVLGADDPRAGGTRTSSAACTPQLDRGTSFGAPDRARGRAGAPRLRGRAVDRDGAHGQLRHRGDDERRARRPRLHRPREDRQVRRLLPRPLGRRSWRPPAAACSRWRCPTARASPRARRPTRCSSSTTTPSALDRALRRARRRDRGAHRRAGRRQHGRRAAGARASSRPAASCARSTAPCSSSTRSSPASAWPGAARRSGSASCPT